MHAKALAWNIFQEGKSLTPVRRSVIKKGKKQVSARSWREGKLRTLFLLSSAPVPRVPAFLLSRLPAGSLRFCSSPLSPRESPGPARLY